MGFFDNNKNLEIYTVILLGVLLFLENGNVRSRALRGC